MKAVIMAGGEGSRMRPLTCDIPKPMMRLCGRPALEYILDLLDENGCDEAVITLRYLQEAILEYFPENKYKNIKLKFVTENVVLGTAGSVKNAAKDFSEPFLVISGDAICDFSLSDFEMLHNKSNNEVSILLSKVVDPREYGLVTLNPLGKINSFIEKPGWSRAVNDLANTGIYFINPSVLEMIPEGREYDFSKDLFPEMLKKNRIMGGFKIDGYWCDIGDFRAYLLCQQDLMLGRVHSNLSIGYNYICSNDGLIPGGKYKIIPPVFIGNDVSIGAGSVIGPGTVIDNGCVIGENVHLKGSCALENVKLDNNSKFTGAIIANNSTVKNSSQMFDGTVLGSQSVLGENSTILQNVLIWPDKNIPANVRVFENVVMQPPQRELFDDEGIRGAADAELGPEVCARLGKACASLKPGIKIGIATDGTRAAKVLKMALQSGAMASGGFIWDFGECFMAQMPFFSSFCGLDIGVFIKTDGNSSGNGSNALLTFCGPDGLQLPQFTESDIEKKLEKSNFSRSNINAGRDISNVNSIRMIYSQELCRIARNSLDGLAVSVQCENDEIARIFREAIDRVGCTYSDSLVIDINPDGTGVTMSERKYPKVEEATLWAICCNDEFKAGRDVAMPDNAPKMLDDIARMYSRKVLRYNTSSNDEATDRAKRLFACQPWAKDALFLSVKVLSIMHDKNKELHELVDEIPRFYVRDKELNINFSPVKLHDIFKDDLARTAFASEGLNLSGKGATALITPSRKGNRIKILVESGNMEAAEEFSSDIMQKIASYLNQK